MHFGCTIKIEPGYTERDRDTETDRDTEIWIKERQSQGDTESGSGRESDREGRRAIFIPYYEQCLGEGKNPHDCIIYRQ